MKAAKVCLSTLMLIVLALLASASAPAQAANGWDTAPPATLAYWEQRLGLPPAAPGVITVNRLYSDPGELRQSYAMPSGLQVYGVQISGSVELRGDHSVMRVILVQADGQEKLVYETLPLMVGVRSYAMQRVCEESCFLAVRPAQSLRIELIDAAFRFDSISYQSQERLSGLALAAAASAIRQAQSEAHIVALNEQIAARGMKWVAAQTPVSQLSYSEKKRRFGVLSDNVVNLQGFEYYKRGIFELRSAVPAQAGPGAPGLVNAFDWSQRHGASWVTAVRDQDGCGSCWAFAATGATEALSNLYFNQHLNLDLSEQDGLSCSGGGSCNGGLPGAALDFYARDGVVDENCFAYQSIDVPCDNKCSNPSERITIAGRLDYSATGSASDEARLKQMLLDYGPLSGGIYSMGHAMTLVGYDLDPDDKRTVWKFKNSWGVGFGEAGYFYTKLSMSDVGWTHALQVPLVSLQPREIACVDNDGDGYYQWGISGAMPASCPASAKPEKDCDDSNAALGAADATGSCRVMVDSARFLLLPTDSRKAGLRLFKPDGGLFPAIAVGEFSVSANAELAIADFDGDGQLDFLAATNDNPSHLYLYRANGPASFVAEFRGVLESDPKAAYWLAQQRPELAPDYGLGLIPADLNHDGKMDFIEARNHDFGNGLFWIAEGNAYLNDGNGQFTKVAQAFDFSSIFTGWTLGMSANLVDLDGDGLPDMVASEQRSGDAVSSGIYLLKGLGDGRFGKPQRLFTSPTPATFISLGDVNGDGRADIVLGMDDDGDPGQTYLFLGYGDGTFSTTPRPAFDTNALESGSDAAGGGKFQLIDVNGDGKLDAIASAALSGPGNPGDPQLASANLLYFPSDGKGGFGPVQVLDAGPLLSNTGFVVPVLPAVPPKLAPRNGDIDGNGSIDADDLALLTRAARPALGPNDPWDINGDGVINVLDARKLALMCTRPQCAAAPRVRR